VKLTEFEALSFDCYGTPIDWDAGISAVLTPWAAKQGCRLGRDEVLVGYSTHESQAETERPTDLYPNILAAALKGLAE
jgi:2-haloacid dehalogenase